MCDSATRTVIEELVEEKVSKEEMFTAWDITKEVRSSGTREPHRSVKRVVHRIFENGEMEGYDRALVSVRPGVPSPFVYHPDGIDPNDYLAQGKVDKASRNGDGDDDDDDDDGDDDTQSSRYAGVSPVKTTKNPDGSIDRTTGDRGYLYLPKDMVSGIGLKVGQKAHVHRASNGNLSISKATGGIATYAVDAKGNVRVHKRYLPKDKCNIKDKNDEIVIS